MIRRLSEWADAAISSPWIFPAYVAARIPMQLWMSEAANSTALGDASMIVLFLISNANRTATCKMQKQLDALAEAEPTIDHEQIARDAGA